MKNSKVNTLFELYFLGRKIKYLAKHRNKDLMFETAILMLLRGSVLTVGQLVKFLSCKISAVSEKISELEKEGLVKKSQAGDLRERTISLTVIGEKEAENFENQISEHCTGMLEELDETELSNFYIILQKLNNYQIKEHIHEEK